MNNHTIQWKSLLPSLELLHNDQLKINRQSELIRSLFQILEKSVQQANQFEEKIYIEQLCTTALLNLYNQFKSGTNKSENKKTSFHFVSFVQMNVIRKISIVKFLWNA